MIWKNMTHLIIRKIIPYTRVIQKRNWEFKDETGGIPITEFVGLRAKLYCYKTTLDEIKKLKEFQNMLSKRI